MPYVIRPKRRKGHLTALLVASLLAFVALPAAARADCPATALSQPYKAQGDSNYYSLIPDGDFSQGTTGWSLKYASLVSRNGGSALSINKRGEAVSPTFCIDANYPTFRFTADTSAGPFTQLNVNLRYPDSFGVLHDVNLGTLSDGGFLSWATSTILPLQTKVPFWQRNDTLNVRLVFDPNTFGNDWSIDDVYVDPYRR